MKKTKRRSQRKNRRSAAHASVSSARLSAAAKLSAVPASADAIAAPFPIVGIGASAGGLDAITQLLKAVPAQTGMAFVVIQHLDRSHESLLSSTLGHATAMSVVEATDGLRVEPNHVYVIPASADIAILRGCLTLLSRPSEGGRQHLPIDFFLRALASELGSRAIGVILSGSGSDGTDGLKAIKAAEGITFAQEPKSARFSDMPQSAIDAKVVDYTLPLGELAEELVRLSRHPYVVAHGTQRSKINDATLNKVLVVVRDAIGVDFSEYKPATLQRQLARRMAIRGMDQPDDYLSLLQTKSDEVRSLFEDVLIHVTSFFRDPEVFAALRAMVFPEILAHKADADPIRCWVAGCATGEEVYSLAIALYEFLGESAHSHPVQIFGSDLSERAIEKARAGLYPESVLRNVSDERRRRFFTRVDNGYRINKMVRDACIFVHHDLARDPPFSKLDLVSCRNVLIYFGMPLQRRVLPAFHYCLNRPGFLLLGHSENIAGMTQMFVPVDKAKRIFARAGARSSLAMAPRAERQTVTPVSAVHATELRPRSAQVSRYLDRLLLARYAPPSVLIDDKLDVLQFRGDTSLYLRAAPGEPQNNLLKMAKGGLLPELRAAIDEAKEQMTPVRKPNVEVRQAQLHRRCDIVVVPITGLPNGAVQLFIVLFEEPAGLPTEARSAVDATHSATDGPSRRLEHELAATQQYLEALIEEHDQAGDELGAANEELVSGNEELQSMNEELETAKEELQSANEELTTVNDELQSRNSELSQVNGDLLNLLAAVDIPILILDLEQRIRRFTPKARGILNVLPSDIGRPLGDLKLNIEVADLGEQITEVVDTVTMKEMEVQDGAGRWHRMQMRPYKTADNRIDGAVLSLVDIDLLKHHVTAARQARAEAELANSAKDQFLATLSHELRTPLSTTLMQAQMLCAGYLKGDQIQRTGEAIERSTKHQVKLIDDLLDVTRIAADKLQTNAVAVDFRSVVKAALETAAEAASRKAVELRPALGNGNSTVSGDPTRLQQVVSNLLTNAIKFTPEGGRVFVGLELARGQAALRVTDTGVGITSEFLPHVFERFVQESKSRSLTMGGLGLGLSIVRHLVELHGGRVDVASDGLGKGATFCVVLPLLSATNGESDASEPHDSMRRPPSQFPARALLDLRILIVDDDDATCDAVGAMLRYAGAKVRVAQSASEAWQELARFKPDIVVCDLLMPVEDGYELIGRIRALGSELGGNTPVIALTALAGKEDAARALAAGFQLHLGKPVEMDRLAQAVLSLRATPAPS
jgi:two-component system CheB/CheR fusion protein